MLTVLRRYDKSPDAGVAGFRPHGRRTHVGNIAVRCFGPPPNARLSAASDDGNARLTWM